MKFQYNDGGRAKAGFKGHTGDCGVRAASIATGVPYKEVYDAINTLAKKERPRKGNKRSNSRTGIRPETMMNYLSPLGWKWIPTMRIGSGCKVHLTDNELPDGHLIVRVSRHYTTVIDQTIHDTYDPQRYGVIAEYGKPLRPLHRCVYGYWVKE